MLSRSGLQCEITGFKSDLSVFVCTAYSDDRLEEIQHFVAEGGGLLMGGHAWYWAQTHLDQNPLTEYSGKITRKGNLIYLKNNMSVFPTGKPRPEPEGSPRHRSVGSPRQASRDWSENKILMNIL